MKKIILILVCLVWLFSNSLLAQGSQPPPDPPGGHGSGSNQTGGNAPVGGGLFILLGLGAAYGGKKWYEQRKEE